jgi:uncharacterized protein YecE (DUF72 family)
MAVVRVGVSGWRYASWRGVFYPEGLPQRSELAFAAERFDSIEINGSFYSLQRPESYRRWYAASPPGFVFAVKGGRYITHMKRLKDVRTALANFFASGLLALEEKLGPILWQFPESLGFEAPRWEDFIASLPRNSAEAAALAAQHAPWLSARAVTESGAVRPLRHAVEIRSPSCATRAFVELLRRQAIALVVADTAGRWPYLEDITADFVYLRLHGSEALYESGYSPAAIDRWAKRVQAWSRGTEPVDARRVAPRAPPARVGRDVYVYFDNDAEVHAPFNALALRSALKASRTRARASHDV